MARPPASELRHRCAGTNVNGAQCGSPAMQGAQLCRVHLLGRKADRKEVRKFDRVGDRLVRMTEQALDRLEQIMAEGSDEVAERACRTILDRTVPRPGPQHAVIVNLPGHGPAATDPGMTPSDIVRQRLAQLREVAARSADEAAMATAPLEDIVDAELVEDGGAA